MWLQSRIGQDVTVQSKFIQAGTSFKWNAKGIHRCIDDVMECRGQLLVLKHMTGGQPARASEIFTIRHNNSMRGQRRNIFIEDGLVVFVTRHHKGYHARQQEKIIHRYVPQEIGESYVYHE